MIVNGLSLLVASVAPSPPPPVAPDAVAAAPAAQQIDALVIDAKVDDLVALEAAVRLRIGACPVSRSDRARPPRRGELFAYLEIEPGVGDRRTLRLTLGDARAWVRTIDAAPTDRTREIATTVGNLFAGIEAEDLAPDLRDVPLPPPLRPASVVVTPPPLPPPAPPRYAWGLQLDGLVLGGLAPGDPLLAIGGAAIRGGVRLRRGALVIAGLRAGVRTRADYTLTRLRIELGGGWAWQWRPFTVHATAAATVEPWFVTTSGRVPATDRRPTGTLLGGALRVAPMGRIAIGRRHLVIGPFVELGGSAMPSGVARVHTAMQGGELAFRLGGLELAGGLTIGLWSARD